MCLCVCTEVSPAARGQGSSNSGKRNLSTGNEIIGTNGYTCRIPCTTHMQSHLNTHIDLRSLVRTHPHTRAALTMSTDNGVVKEPDAPFPLVVATNELTQWLNMDRL